MKDYYSVEEDLEEKMFLLNEKDKEIERLQMAVKDTKENADAIIIEQQEEIERLCNTLNEVIEINTKAIKYIEDNMSETKDGHVHLNFQGNVLDIYLILKGVDNNG